MDAKEYKIATFAFSSRVFLLIFQCLSNIVIPDHDAGVFYPPRDKSNTSWLDEVVHFLLGGLQRWDAVYFTHISEFGYIYENSVAFFPMFPLVTYSISSCLQVFGVLNSSSWILLTSVLVNTILFIVTAVLLYRLGKHTVNADTAFYGAAVFCINPASIFMTAPYSEIMYMFLLMIALLKLQEGALFTSSFFLGLCVFTRSNGIVTIGFILHYIGKTLVLNIQVSVLARNVHFITGIKYTLYLLLQSATKTAICVAISLTPFFMYQFYIYQKFCLAPNSSESLPTHLVAYGRSQGYHLLGDKPSPWCRDYIPLSYSYIQKHHWNVGFLHYYQLKQLPNFFLATPVILLSVASCRHFVKASPKLYYTLGLYPLKVTSNPQAESAELKSNIGGIRQRVNTGSTALPGTSENERAKSSSMSEGIAVYIFHLLSLTLFGCCFIHIQVLTRFLCSSSPVLYWYSGALYAQDSSDTSTRQNPSADHHQHSKAKKANAVECSLNMLSRCHCDFIVDVIKRWHMLSFTFRAVFIYSLLYCVVGTIMFSNFLPWT